MQMCWKWVKSIQKNRLYVEINDEWAKRCIELNNKWANAYNSIIKEKEND